MSKKILSAVALAVMVTALGWGMRGDAKPGLRRLLPDAGTPAAVHSMAKADTAPGAGRWSIQYHGTCCEGNIAAQGASTYVLLPVLVNGNKIIRSNDEGKTWTQQYPPVDASVPFGIEGDMQAYGDDVIFFGTEVAAAMVAHSDDRGDSWTVVQVPVASAGNDQAWSYLAPIADLCPVPSPTNEPYMLGGWFRIGTEAIFSCDGGLTWPIHAPLMVGDDGSGPRHPICEQLASAPQDQGDTRVADSNFASIKAGRHGAFGTDRRFYWTMPLAGQLYVCRTGDFGRTWEGTVHPIADGPGSGFVVSHAAFDQNGTLYVLHGDFIYVSFDQGHRFRYTHELPRYGNAMRTDSGSDQFFAVQGGKIHIGLIESYGDNNAGRIWYLAGRDLDSATPRWHAEPVDITDFDRLDFMQIAVTGNGTPTLSYTTPVPAGDATAVREVTTASLQTRAPYAGLAITPDNGAAPLDVELDASSSSDLDAEALSYAFDFGDGSAAVMQTGAKAQHSYGKAGSYTASVTVRNPKGESSSAQATVTIAGAKAAASPAKFGGAMPLFGLLGLAVAAALRRRRR